MAARISQIVSRICICMAAFCVVPAAGQNPDDVRPQASFRDIEFQGNEAFTPPQLLAELAQKTDLSDPSGKIAVDDAGCRLLERSLLAGYHASGYPEAKVRVALTSGKLIAAIEEGPIYRMAAVHVIGPEPSSNTLFAEIISSEISADQSDSDEEGLTAPSRLIVLRAMRPGTVAFQKPNSSDALEKRIRDLLEADGFLYPDFAASFETDTESKTVRPLIQLRATGPRLKISDVQFSGLKRNRREDVEALLKVDAGTEYSRELAVQIRNTLFRTGRFLHVHVWHDFPFGPGQDVSLHVDVREFDLIPSLAEELSEPQQVALQFGDWLNRWNSSPNDLVINADFSTASFEESERSSAGFYNTGTEMHGSAALLFPHLSAESRVKLRAVVSPQRGTAISVFVMGKDGVERDHRRLIIAQNLVTVLFPESGRYWQSDNPRQGCTLFCNMVGLPEPSENRVNLLFGMKTNSFDSSGLKLSLTANPAAMIYTLLNEREGKVTLTEEDGRQVLKSEAIRLTVEGKSGEKISSLELRHGDKLHVQIRSEVGAFQKEVNVTRQAANGLPNLCQKTDEPGSLLTTLLSELGPHWSKTEPLLSQLAAALVDHPESISGILSSFPDLTEGSDFRIPEDGEYRNRQNSGVGSMSYILSRLGPKDSGAGRLSEALRKSLLVDSRGAWNEYLQSLISDPQRGAMDCLLPARYFANDREQIASAGLQKMSTQSFVTDMNRYLAQPCVVQELLVLAVKHIRATDDAEFEVLVRDLERALHDEASTEQVSIRPLLVMIRRHNREEPLEIVREMLPTVWEGGLQQHVRQRLQQWIELEKNSFRHKVREVSSGQELDQEAVIE